METLYTSIGDPFGIPGQDIWLLVIILLFLSVLMYAYRITGDRYLAGVLAGVTLLIGAAMGVSPIWIPLLFWFSFIGVFGLRMAWDTT